MRVMAIATFKPSSRINFMKKTLLLSLLLLYVPISAFAGVIYTYTGNTMSCAGTCSDTGGPYAVGVTLAFATALNPDAEYVNATYLSLIAPSTVPGATDVAGLLTSWSVSDGVSTVDASASGATFSLYLKTDASGQIEYWSLASQNNPAAGEMLILGTLNGVIVTDQKVYQTNVGTPEQNTDVWNVQEDPGTWSSEPTSASVPEPATLTLGGLSLCMLAFWRRGAGR
jgi:hypothetical protein